MENEQRGDSRVSLLLTGVTDEEVERIAQRIADLAVEEGLVDDESCTALIAAEGFEWPDTPEEMIRSLSGAGFVLIPASVDEEMARNGD